MKWSLVLWLSLIVLGFSFCHSNANSKEKATVLSSETSSSITYDLSKPVQSWNLPEVLKEISGNAWVDNNHLLVIEDLHPVLYLMRLDKGAATIEKQIPFKPVSDKKFDIEDIAISGNTAYALWSHGTVYKIDNWRMQPSVTEWETGLDKANNTEGLTIDPTSGNLLVACKNESGVDDEKKSARSVYELNAQTGKLNNDPFLVIEKKEIMKVAGDKLAFYPSAIAVHPATHDIYVLSTKETKCMVQYSHDGKIKGFQMIDKEIMPQPEGMCFAPDGTLFISTEGRHGEPAKIYQFNAGK